MDVLDASCAFDSEAASVAAAAGSLLLVVDPLVRQRFGEQPLFALARPVVAASSPEEVLLLSRAELGELAIAFLDHSLPGVTGLELARELARRRPGLPIVLMTTRPTEFPLALLALAGVRRVIRRPPRLDAILELAEHLLR